MKELEAIEILTKLYDVAANKEILLGMIIAFIIAKDVEEFKDFMDNPEKMKPLGALELYVF